MALTLPKIIFPSGGGTTLNFTYPPTQKPGIGPYEEIIHRNISSAGVVEIIDERTDTFVELTMENVLSSELAAWDTFVQSAIRGVLFDYYPDATSGTHTTYLLEDTSFSAPRKHLGMYSFNMKFRKAVSWP